MRLLEHEAKIIFQKHGIPVPTGSIAESVLEVRNIAEKLHKPIAIKSQIPLGRRGKAGGIRFARTVDEAEQISSILLKSEIEGYQIKQLLIEEMLIAREEYYLGVTFDTSAGMPIVMLSTHGGINIEEIVKKNPERICSRHVDILMGLQPFEGRILAKTCGIKGTILNQVSILLTRLYQIFEEYNALTAEINPLALDEQGNLVALDARLEVDDGVSAKCQDIHSKPEDRIINELEKKACRLGFSYVQLDGNIGTFCVGAGLAMLTIDLLSLQGGSPANFIDTGGAPSPSLVKEALKTVLEKPGLKGLLINIYGGLTDLKQTASSIVDVLSQKRLDIPVVAKLHGPNQEEAWKILESHHIEVAKSIKTEEATKKMVSLVRI
jgi:succinyl-CoA synthetase beta subunit